MPRDARALAIDALVKLVFGVRRRVLERPFARGALRAIGWPAIKLMHRMAGPGAGQGPLQRRESEPVLRLPLGYEVGESGVGRIGVILHAYYVDVAPDVLERLQNVPAPADVFISTDTAEKAEALRRSFAAWDKGAVEVRIAPNRGRNIAPQLIAFRDVYATHPLVLLIHGKKSEHNGALAGWRDFLMRSLLGSPAAVRGIVETFARLPNLGVLAPRTYSAVRQHMIWGENYPVCRDLGTRLGVAIYPDSPLDFPAGAMFWARSAALKPLLDLDLSFDDFDDEDGQTDGTLAHAIERLVFHACEQAGYRWARAGDAEQPTVEEVFVPSDNPRALQRLVSDYGRAMVRPGRRPMSTPRPADKAALRALFAADLYAFMASERRLALATSEAPAVSIVMVTYNQAELTFQALRALQFGLDVPAEIIVVDNASNDDTLAMLARVDGLRVVANAQNLHFLRAVNQAAPLARGRHILLLNNDVRIEPGAVSQALSRLDTDPGLGAVGGRIALMDGTLQEAGSIVWRDGACLGYGRGADPEDPQFQFRREVDYCSGAFLMTPRQTFARLGGFDEAFAPAYYEETDYCMRLWAAGLRVAYDPQVRLSHFEFGSAAAPETSLALQTRNRETFAAAHAAALAGQAVAGDVLAARQRDTRPRLLIVEDEVPFPDLGAGYPRALDILKSAHRAGWAITLYPLVEADVDWDAAYRIIPRDVEIAAERGVAGLDGFLRERGGWYDAAIVSRPHNMARVRRALKRNPHALPLAKIAYDAEAIFALRGRDPDKAEALQSRAVRDELALIEGAGAVMAVNALEADIFRRAGGRGVDVVGHARNPTPTARSFDGRRDLLFAGALDADQTPNADSIVFFVREVMPVLDRLIGADYVLHVAGRNAAPSVRALASERVKLLGRVADLSELYDSARVFIAPTRFAAGIPMKVHEAAAMGLPAAVTGLLARQLGWTDGEAVAVGDGADGFADAVARLYRDETLWRSVRKGALDRVLAECAPAAFDGRVAAILDRVAGR